MTDEEGNEKYWIDPADQHFVRDAIHRILRN